MSNKIIRDNPYNVEHGLERSKLRERIAELEAKLKSAEKDKQYANGKLSEAIVKLNELREILTEQAAERGEGK